MHKDFSLKYFSESWITFLSKIVNRLTRSNAMSLFSGNGIVKRCTCVKTGEQSMHHIPFKI